MPALPPALYDLAGAHHLSPSGALHLTPGELPGQQTLVLLSPAEPGFWAYFTATPEYRDGARDPMNRWSTRIISAMAQTLGATPLFPFSGPPWQPFTDWARRSARAWPSPVGLLVHDAAGLMISYRGALAFPDRFSLPPPGARPCDTCAGQPCRSACPVDALSGAGYDVAACHSFLDTEAGRDCLDKGCRARRFCPVSETYGRRPEQSAFHMQSFHPTVG